VADPSKRALESTAFSALVQMTGGVTWTEIPADIRDGYKFRRRSDLPGAGEFGTPVQVKVSASPPGGGPRFTSWIWNPEFPAARKQQDALLVPWGAGEERPPSYAENLPAAPPITLPDGSINIPDGGSIDPPDTIPDDPTSGTGGSGNGGSGRSDDDDGFVVGEAIAALANGIFERRRRVGSRLPTRPQTRPKTAGFGSTLGIIALVGGVGLAAYLVTSSATAPPPRRALPRENSSREEEEDNY
jgi:hypothetical protein